MIIKFTPGDFRVEELTDVIPGVGGRHALYRLDKRSWTTTDALAAVRRRWKISPNRLSYGGLKDRHAHTIQHFTILRGPERNLTHHGFRVDYLGTVAEPFRAEHIRANRFGIVIRRIAAAELPPMLAALDEVRRFGVPNYFDDQRFGSVGTGGEFFARFLLHGDFEGALRHALAAPYDFDRAEAKREKALLRSHWRDWPTLKEKLPRSHARSLVSYLVDHPDDFRGTVNILRPELRGLYLSAYQSHLWNRMLAHWLREQIPADDLVNVRLKLGTAPMHRTAPAHIFDELRALRLPLHSPRQRWEDNDARRPYFDRVLADEGVTLEQFKLKGLRELFFSKGERPALCLPAAIQAEPATDETRPHEKKLTLSFDLPRGSYATLMVKGLARAAAADDEAVPSLDSPDSN